MARILGFVVIYFSVCLIGQSSSANSAVFASFELSNHQYVYIIQDSDAVDHRPGVNPNGYRLFKGPIESMKEFAVAHSAVVQMNGMILELSNGEKFQYLPEANDIVYLSPNRAALDGQVIDSTTLVPIFLELQNKFVLQIVAIGGQYILPQKIAYGLVFDDDDKTNDRIYDICKFSKDDSGMIQNNCESFGFSSDVALRKVILYRDNKEHSPVLATNVRIFAQTGGWGVADISNDQLQSCVKQLRAQINGTQCKPFYLQDERRIYWISIQKVEETWSKANF